MEENHPFRQRFTASERISAGCCVATLRFHHLTFCAGSVYERIQASAK
jgi:hypothetical protein